MNRLLALVSCPSLSSSSFDHSPHMPCIMYTSFGATSNNLLKCIERNSHNLLYTCDSLRNSKRLLSEGGLLEPPVLPSVQIKPLGLSQPVSQTLSLECRPPVICKFTSEAHCSENHSCFSAIYAKLDSDLFLIQNGRNQCRNPSRSYWFAARV
jgi:hypothetical protein